MKNFPAELLEPTHLMTTNALTTLALNPVTSIQSMLPSHVSVPCATLTRRMKFMNTSTSMMIFLLVLPLSSAAEGTPSLHPTPLYRPSLIAIRERQLTVATGSNERMLCVSLLKNLIGAGVFALPAGVSGTGLGPAVLLTIGVGVLSWWTFYALGRAASETGSATYAELWSRTVGRRAWLVDGAVVAMAFGGCVQFMATMTTLLPVGAGELGGWRRKILVTALATLPLCLAPHLKALEASSMVGMLGVLYSCVYVCCRLSDGSYAASAPTRARELLLPPGISLLSALPFVGR